MMTYERYALGPSGRPTDDRPPLLALPHNQWFAGCDHLNDHGNLQPREVLDKPRTTRSGLARLPFRFGAEAVIECAHRSPLLAAVGSVSKHRWLSLSRPSGHRVGRPARCR